MGLVCGLEKKCKVRELRSCETYMCEYRSFGWHFIIILMNDLGGAGEACVEKRKGGGDFIS